MSHYVNRPCAVLGYDDLTCSQYVGLIHRAIIDGELLAAKYYIRLAESCNAVHDLILAAKEIRAEHLRQVACAEEWDDQAKTKFGVANPFGDVKKSGTYPRTLPEVVSPPIKKKKFFP